MTRQQPFARPIETTSNIHMQEEGVAIMASYLVGRLGIEDDWKRTA